MDDILAKLQAALQALQPTIEKILDWHRTDPLMNNIILGVSALILIVILLLKRKKPKKKTNKNHLDLALAKTREGGLGSLKSLFSIGRKIDDDLLEELQQLLISADVGAKITAQLIERLSEAYSGKEVSSNDDIMAKLKSYILEEINSNNEKSSVIIGSDGKPHVILIIGVNGTGKTTSIGKLTNVLSKAGHSILLGASDTFRAAAGEQLNVWAQRNSVEIVRQQEGADPAAVAFDAADAALARDKDVLIIDTAGRLHNKANLMQELVKIKRVIQKKIPSGPHEVLLVIDAGMGQNALQQARVFKEDIGVTGIIATKLDGTAKGGILLAIQREMGIPIRFIGTGEGIDDFAAFDTEKFVDALLS